MAENDKSRQDRKNLDKIEARMNELTPKIQSMRCDRDKDLFCLVEAKQAACDGHLEIVEFLVNNVSNDRLRDQYCFEMAERAASEGKLEIAKFLLQTLSEQSVKTQCLMKATESSASEGQLHVVEFLVKAAAAEGSCLKDRCCIEATKSAASLGKLEVSQFLVQSIGDVSTRDSCCMKAAKRAASNGDLKVFEFLYQSIENNHLRSDFRRSCAEAACSSLQDHIVAFVGLEPNWLFQSVPIFSFIASMAIEGKNSVLNETLARMQSDWVTQLLGLSICQGQVALALTLISSDRFSTEHVDLPDSNQATALMLAADAGHHELIEKLLDLGGSVRAIDNLGRTALSRACEAGHVRAAKALLDRGADPRHQDSRGLTCPELAKRFGQFQVVRLLEPCFFEFRDMRLSEALHRLLSEAGFTQERAEYQQGMAKWLEKVAQILTNDGRRMTGSYAEGWANSLVQMNGRTSHDSDIDWTVLVSRQIFHLEGGCDGVTTITGCRDATKLRVTEGHAQVPMGSGSQPSVATKANGVRPSQDLCHAIQCCSSFKDERFRMLLPFTLENVHLVRATRPNVSKELRVSFSFHERRVMRALNTVQGQLFTVLKFIFKYYLPVNLSTPGLKTYHAKTLLFFMLERHGVKNTDVWQPQNLIGLLKESLDMMISFIDSSASPDVCMPHFFMKDAMLYFKNAGIGGDFDNTKARVRDLLSEQRSNPDGIIERMKRLVRPLRSERFYFYPFTLLPLTGKKDVKKIRTTTTTTNTYENFADAYCLMHQYVSELQSESSDRDTLMRQLSLFSQIDCCSCITACATVLVHLKFNEIEEAERQVKELQTRQFSRNWAWRLCSPCNTQPRFPFLPNFTQTLLTVRLSQPAHLYVNFRCLSWSLQAELLRNDPTVIPFNSWLEELQEDPDLEELLTLAHYSDCREHVEFCLRQMDTIKEDRRVVMEMTDKEKIQWVRQKLERLDADFPSADKASQTSFTTDF